MYFTNLQFFLSIYRPSMSHGTGLGQDRYQERDFVLATTEEFVKRFGGTRVINKVINFVLYKQQIVIILKSNLI